MTERIFKQSDVYTRSNLLHFSSLQNRGVLWIFSNTYGFSYVNSWRVTTSNHFYKKNPSYYILDRILKTLKIFLLKGFFWSFFQCAVLELYYKFTHKHFSKNFSSFPEFFTVIFWNVGMTMKTSWWQFVAFEIIATKRRSLCVKGFIKLLLISMV